MQYVILTATGVVSPASIPGVLYGCTLTTTVAGTVAFRNGGASGTILFTANVAANDTVQFEFKKPIRFSTDIYATLTNVTFAYINFEYNKGNV